MNCKITPEQQQRITDFIIAEIELKQFIRQRECLRSQVIDYEGRVRRATRRVKELSAAINEAE